MASIRRDIVNRTDEVDIRAIDNGLKNPWRWNWLEKNVNGVYVREVIRKLVEEWPIALYAPRNYYMGPGDYPPSPSICRVSAHLESQEKSWKIMDLDNGLKLSWKVMNFLKKCIKIMENGRLSWIRSAAKRKKKKSLLRIFFFFVLRSVDLIDVSIHR